MNKLNQKISQKLKKAKIKPKRYFTLLNILKDIGLVLLLIIAVLALGIIAYIITQNNPWEFLPSGFFSYLRGLVLLPWELIGLFALIIVAIYSLIKKVHFIYRLNNIVIVIAVALITLGGYFIAEATGLNEVVSRAPIAKQIYQKQGRFLAPNRGPIVSGEIIKIEDKKLTISDHQNKEWKIIISDSTRVPSGDEFKIGDIIHVVGKKDGQKIEAFGVKKVGDKFRGFMNKPRIKGKKIPGFSPK